MFVVLMYGYQFFTDGVMRKKTRGMARVLGRDDVDRLQHLQRPQRDVLQVSNRCGYNI